MKQARKPALAILLALLASPFTVSEGRPANSERGAFQQSLGGQAVEPNVIRVESSLVSVPVSVTDSAGRVVRDLSINDFRIEENGRPEILARIDEAGETPLDLALLLDVSGSVLPRFEFERDAAARFLRKVQRPQDMLAIFSIGPRPGLLMPRTADLGAAMRVLAGALPSRGSTAFYDAVVMAAHRLRQPGVPDSRRVLIVISDGEDNNSEAYSFDEVAREIQRSDCLFYSINPAGPSIHLNRISIEAQNAMLSLASETGGSAFLPDGADELDAIFDVITTELRAQYLLEYYSSNQDGDGSFRRIVVSTPGHSGLRIRARQGYYPAGGWWRRGGPPLYLRSNHKRQQ